MGLICFYGVEYQRRGSSIALLLFIAIILVSWSPLSIIYDASLGLSFMASLSILLYNTTIEKFLHTRLRVPKSIANILSITFAASIGSFPVLIYYFGTISIGGILANITIAWVVGCIMILGILYILMGIIGGYILYIFGYILYLPTHYILMITDFFQYSLQVGIPMDLRAPISVIILGYMMIDTLDRERRKLADTK
jgi:competence protein ComEC